MTILLTVATALLITFIGARIATYFKYPPILGQFIFSFVLAVPMVKGTLFNEQSFQVIEVFSELAIVFLLLLAGLRTNLNRVNHCKKEAGYIALLGIIASFTGGFLAGRFIGFSAVASLILGFTIAITAEGTNLAILLQLKKLQTKLGSIVISAGIINDIFGILFLAITLILTHQNGISSLALFPLRLLLFVAIVWLIRHLLPGILGYFEKHKKEVAMFNLMILTALIFAILSEIIGLSAILGAFIAGIILQKSFLLKRDERHEEHEMETLLFGFIIPFFFINIALNFKFDILMESPWLVVSISLIALFGKLIGSLMARPFTQLKLKQLQLVGWEMNSRGMIELIIAELALSAGLIPGSLYSAIIITAVVTTLISPFFVRHLIKVHPRIMTQ